MWSTYRAMPKMMVMVMVTMETVIVTTAMTTTMNDKTVQSARSHHENVGVGISEGAEVSHGVLDECPKDEAEADAQVHIDGLDEAIGVWQRRPGSHHQGGHGENGGHSCSRKHRHKYHNK